MTERHDRNPLLRQFNDTTASRRPLGKIDRKNYIHHERSCFDSRRRRRTGGGGRGWGRGGFKRRWRRRRRRRRRRTTPWADRSRPGCGRRRCRRCGPRAATSWSRVARRAGREKKNEKYSQCKTIPSSQHPLRATSVNERSFRRRT